MGNLFMTQAIIIMIIFAVLSFVNFFSYSIWEKFNNHLLKINKISFLRVIRICCVVIFLGIIIFKGNFIDDSKTLLVITAPSGSSNFKDVLLKYNMHDYITPSEIKCSAGNNIIIISMESLEQAFLNDKYSSLTPNLNELKNNWSYIDMSQNSGSAWTSGSLYTCLTGFPAYFGVHRNKIFQTSYHADISSISHVLRKADYQTIFLGANTSFSGVKQMLRVFKFHKIIDYLNSPVTGYESSYGLRDKELFTIAKSEVELQNDSKKPFALFISTTDTHFPNGIYDERMETLVAPQETQLEFMIASLDYLIGDFIAFLKKRNILENTSIFLFPDHLKMGTSAMFDNKEDRRLYLITNSKNIELEDEEIYQIDLPKIILTGSNIDHNLKFLTDYISYNKEQFIKDNILGITEINTSGFLTSKSFEDNSE